MKKSLFAGMLIGLVACSPSIENTETELTPDTENQSVTIPKAEEGFKAYEAEKTWIMYPNDWTLDTADTEDMDYFIYSPLSATNDEFQENINLTTEKLPNNSITTEFYVKSALEMVAKSIQNVEVLENKEQTGNFGSYRTIVYTGTMSNMNLKWKQSVYIKNSTAYIISFTSIADTYNSFDTITTKMMKSFIVK